MPVDPNTCPTKASQESCRTYQVTDYSHARYPSMKLGLCLAAHDSPVSEAYTRTKHNQQVGPRTDGCELASSTAAVVSDKTQIIRCHRRITGI